MKQAFVTGGSGFLGRALLGELAVRGVPARALARSDAAAAAVEAQGATAVPGDLSDAEAIRRGAEGCDVAFHAAARVGTWGPWAEFVAGTIDGTKNALEGARAAGVRRFVHVSTEAVLVGGRPIHGADETWPLPDKPIGAYPRSKGAAERLVRAANAPGIEGAFGFETVIVRPRFIWGRGDATLLPEIVRLVKAGKFKWIGGGRYPTSTCHIDNVVEGLLLAAERGDAGETWFLTDGEPVEMRAFLSRLIATQGVDTEAGPHKVGSLPRWVARAAAATMEGVWRALGKKTPPPLDRTTVRLVGEEVTVSDAKARAELGYTAHKSMEAGLAELAAGVSPPR